MVGKRLRAQVRDRVGARYEYCRVPEQFFDEPFWIDHVTPEQHGGATTLENLAFCCMRCNRHKGPNLAGHDPVSNSGAFIFNPREEAWGDHFEWSGAVIIGKTSTGRATVGP